MADVHSPKQRSKNMSAIKGKNTKPEMMLRKFLWSEGFRYRVNYKLPGKPDIVFPSAKIAVFVDGCFWHKCPEHFKMPATRTEFWDNKISRNVERDQKVSKKLQTKGWTILRFWEHEIKEDVEKVASVVIEKHENATFII